MLSTLFNGIIRFALHNRMLVAAIATFLLLYGGWQMSQLPVDVFPDLNRPRVVIMTEAHGLAPEEVETLVSFPIESSINGASGVQVVRSSSGVGLSVIQIEFDWGTDVLDNRQVIAERLAVVASQLPQGVRPQLAPISSIMGQIAMVGMVSETREDNLLFTTAGGDRESGDDDAFEQLNGGRLSDHLRSEFQNNDIILSDQLDVRVESQNQKWIVGDLETDQWYAIVPSVQNGIQEGIQSGNQFSVHQRTSPMRMRTIADWTIRQRLLTIPGISQIFVMGGDRKQYQVLLNPDQLNRFGVTLHDVEEALEMSNSNATGGYLDEQGPNELLVRVLGRIDSIEEIRDVVVKRVNGQTITLDQVARITAGATVKRGDSSLYLRQDSEDPEIAETFKGGPSIIFTITKQPDADTRKVTERVEAAMADLAMDMPADVRLEKEVYQQKQFIDHAIANVIEALRDGGILVVIVLFLFLLNLRTTFITLTAIPLSIAITALIFWVFGLTINTMTLGGLAVAIGELVDDAIVDVENVFRRLKENRAAGSPKNPLLVVYQASVEIRNSIVFGTLIVILVFIPLFALDGMEGLLFAPMGVAYIVSILASLLVSLTVTPVLSYWLLAGKQSEGREEKDSFLLRGLKWVAEKLIHMSTSMAVPILIVALLLVSVAGFTAWHFQRDFLPPFNEGSMQINVMMPPGTSLKKSVRIAEIAGQRIREVPEVKSLARRTGRAELDEHAMGVNASEFIASMSESERSRETVVNEIRDQLATVPGIIYGVEQPLTHLMSHMVSGVKAQVGIKLFGEDLGVLLKTANQIEAVIKTVSGVKDVQVEQQMEIPQLQITVSGERLKQYGLRRSDVTEFVETAMNGHVVSEIIDGQRKYDLMLRLEENVREDLNAVKRLLIDLPDGGVVKLEDVADVRQSLGPNIINREQVRRRIIIQCNVSGRGLVDVVNDIRQQVAPIEEDLPLGYVIEYGGQFESQQSASRMILILSGVSLIGMLLVLYSMFNSFNLALQVMVALPMAFIGSVAALRLTDQTLSIAAMVGFISLCGIATRNGILLINHYLHLVKHEGEGWTREMIARAGKERLPPVLMTCLTTGIGLVPLALAAGETGKEILYPVATVIIGGLITSTMLEFLVRPALFWKFGISSARKSLEAQTQAVPLTGQSQDQQKAL